MSSTGPYIATMAALEQSMKKFSLSATREHRGSANATVELNSNVALPYQWEQCLDMKTGDLYYRNWQTGMRSSKDPRVTSSFIIPYHSEEEDEDVEEEYDVDDVRSSSSSESSSPPSPSKTEDFVHVLVAAGCKGCLKYFMIPKHIAECPECEGLLIHFNGLKNGDV